MPAPRWRWGYAAAACTLVASVCVAWLGVSLNLKPNTTFETKAGESRQLTLADGSVIQALPQTTLQQSLTPRQRYVRLLNGEAKFAVAKEPYRPFIVETRNLRAEAVGTQFTVRIDDDTTILTVTEGKVRVRRTVSRPAQSIYDDIVLFPSESIKASAHSVILSVRHSDLPWELRWSESWRLFEGETLGEAIDLFNRVNTVQLVIDDPQLARVRIAGYRVKVDNLEGFVRLLNSELGVHTSRKGDRIHLRFGRESPFDEPPQ
jgi:transmembrane sensor